MLQPLVYVNFEFAEIKNLGDFLKTNGAKESAKVKSLYENLKMLFFIKPFYSQSFIDKCRAFEENFYYTDK